jgi:hypothetical protein
MPFRIAWRTSRKNLMIFGTVGVPSAVTPHATKEKREAISSWERMT